ncbi:ty3-gypsy retrotransposon protein [Tanacetum coccineum]|uniref:Ty3-gypsy retrotransposon protein n=1 Tax=Tanacetum coccineum TaxID=301880 RepID=A0ABQ5IGY2_9ASTR
MPPRKDTSNDDQPTSLQDQIAALNTKFDTLLTHLLQAPPPPPPPPPPPHTQPRPPKIFLPNFDGSNPLDWIFQANNYFEYYSILPAQRVALTAFYFTGDALSWYKHLAHNHLLGTWEEFSRALQLRFGPSTYENHQATLFKLKQTSTVSAYQTEFERISNFVNGLSPEALLNCFISGLRADIQNEIAIHHPTSLQQAYGLAKLIKDKLAGYRPRYNPYPRPPFSTPNPLPKPVNPALTANPNFTPATTALLPTPKPRPPLPFTRLSPEALQKRRAEGLCFRCPEKYQPGHVCNPPQFLLIADNEQPADTDPLPDSEFLNLDHTDPTDNHTPYYLALSDAAFYGLQSPRAVRVTGYIGNKPVTVLVDCGSTHNIIQPRIAALLASKPAPITPFPVMVGNGQFLECNNLFPNTPLEINKFTFNVPLFVLPVAGADVILGLAWLGSLGTIVADFSIPKLTFTVNGSTCVLQGKPI